MSVNHSAKSGGIIGISPRFNMKVCCVFSFESPHQSDSNEYTQYTIFNMNKKNTLNYPKSAAMIFFLGTQARVRKSHGKRVISVRATEVLLYIISCSSSKMYDTQNFPYYSRTSMARTLMARLPWLFRTLS